MILVADSHVSEAKGNVQEFFAMLTALSASAHDVVFLGDILDLWIALPGYEQDLHRRFAEWCREEKGRRSVGFVEGNHEFFLHKHHHDIFTFSSTLHYQDGAGTLYTHGDLINTSDIGYRRFRCAIRNPFTEGLMRCLPGGPRVAAMVKRKMNARSAGFPKNLPEAHIKTFADEQFAVGVKRIFCGHFHRSFDYSGADGQVLHVVPQWQRTGLIGVLEAAGGYTAQPWQEVLS